MTNKFAEYEKFKKNYYGISFQSVLDVIRDKKKFCVFCPKPTSLKQFRTADFKPFVVFISPPSTACLRKMMMKKKENVKVRSFFIFYFKFFKCKLIVRL